MYRETTDFYLLTNIYLFIIYYINYQRLFYLFILFI